MKDEKLQKALARMGLGSRRQMEEVIKAGRVTVNNGPATVGDRVEQGDEIRVDGRQIKYTAENEKRRRVLAYYKPEGEVCSASDPEGRPTVFERLPKLMHPSSEVTREYAVRVLGEVTPDIARTLTAGVMLEDGMAQFEDIKEGGGEGVNKWYHVRLKEGRNREVRRLFESQGLKVSRLLRTRYGSIALPKELRTGRFLELDKKDINTLTDLVSLRPRHGTGLHGAAKEKQERIKSKPLKARRVDTRNDNRPSSAKPKSSGSPASRGSRNTRDRNNKR